MQLEDKDWQYFVRLYRDEDRRNQTRIVYVFHDIYIDGKENAKMTGDSMKMLMLTLPFLVRDLIAPEVDVLVCTGMYLFVL